MAQSCCKILRHKKKYFNGLLKHKAKMIKAKDMKPILFIIKQNNFVPQRQRRKKGACLLIQNQIYISKILATQYS